ncbi:MAG: peptidylprolyl isomerase [candidate division Zixibacteria bacterium]|jgi:foldase protein PrsA|nr:peptidylprolyl isomerase [candidate division Zixibacteria bacterium]
MRTHNLILVSMIAACGLLLAAGCGSGGNETIAEVNGYEITKQEFQDYIRGLHYPYTSAQEEFDKKRAILDTLIIQRLLIEEAYNRGIDKLDEINRLILANKDKFLLDGLYQKHVVGQVEVTDTEVRDFYNRLQYRVRASHILVSSKDTADMLVQRIVDGENFGNLAYQYSEDPQAKRNRGDLGYFTWGAMVEEFQQAAFNMEPGEVSPPVKSQFGYHIIKVVDRSENPEWGDYDAVKDQLEARLSRLKQDRLAQAYFDGIKARYPITLDTATIDYLEHKRTHMYPPQVLATLPSNDFDIEQLDRSERELVLATWDGGQMTLFQYLVRAREMLHPQVRPAYTDYDSIATMVFQLNVQDILVREAIDEGIENTPEYQRKIKFFKELNMADVFKMDSMPQPPAPTEAQMRMYYDKHPEEFTDQAKVHIFEILVSDEMLANKLAREIKTLTQFKKMAEQYTERPAKRGTNGDLDYIESKWFPEVFEEAWKTPVGQLGGPVPTVGRYSIFWVVDKVPAALKDYLGQKPQIQSTIIREQRAEAFKKWVDEKRTESSISVHDDVLWEIIDKKAYAATDSTSAEG